MTNADVFPLNVSIIVLNEAQLRSVYAVLAGASLSQAVDFHTQNVSGAPMTGNAVATPATPHAAAPMPAAEQSGAAADASPSDDDDDEIDADGHPFDPALHTGTKTKAGLWRMKAGVSRPAPKPGFPLNQTDGAETTGTDTQHGDSAEASVPVTEPEVAAGDEDDEFAAFRDAAAKSDAEEATAKASVPARKWTDADLGALCNLAATKLGNPAPIKEIIARFVPDGAVAHSRNVPEDQRDFFAKAIEAKADIEFAG